MEPISGQDKNKRLVIWDIALYFLGCAALGSIIVLPWQIANLAHEVEVASTVYFATEACKAGADLDVCDALRKRRTNVFIEQAKPLTPKTPDLYDDEAA